MKSTVVDESLSTNATRVLFLEKHYFITSRDNRMGKEMILSDFLSRQTHDDSDPHDIIPIPFNMHNMLYEKYYKIEMKERYFVQTCL